jgi:hypothetical protein
VLQRPLHGQRRGARRARERRVHHQPRRVVLAVAACGVACGAMMPARDGDGAVGRGLGDRRRGARVRLRKRGKTGIVNC